MFPFQVNHLESLKYLEFLLRHNEVVGGQENLNVSVDCGGDVSDINMDDDETGDD